MLLQIPKGKRFTYSPLRYPGGKALLYPFVEKIISDNNLNGGVYIEPFAGGSATALSLLMLGKVERVIINDYDFAIYSFWRAILHEPEKFIAKIRRTPLSMRVWRMQKKIYETERGDFFKLGFATFYLNRTNHSGVLNGGPIGGINQNGGWKIDARFNKTELISRICKIAHYRRRIQIKNEDGIALTKKVMDKKGTALIYLDPPYYVKGSCLYLNHYKEDDHKKLATLLNRYNHKKWLLTYDDAPQIRRLYSKRRIYDFSLNYHVSGVKTGSEIMICSDGIKINR